MPFLRSILLLAACGLALLGAASSASAATVVDTTPGNDTVASFGHSSTATYGQTFTVPAGEPELDDFTVYFALPDTLQLRGYVYAWDEAAGQAVGPQLYRSDPVTPSGDAGHDELAFAPNVTLTPGEDYVFFVSISEFSGSGSGTGNASTVSPPGSYDGGHFVYFNNGYDPGLWNSANWDGADRTDDLAFRATFSQAGRDVLIVTSDCADVDENAADLADEPGIGDVDVVDAGSDDAEDTTPSAEQLAAYDLVVSASNCNYDDPALYGDRLADYVDDGGRLLQFAYDMWQGSDSARPQGRFAADGYHPFLPGDNVNSETTLGGYDEDHDLMQGVAELGTVDNVDSELAPGAELVASWADGRAAIATKGRVSAVTASIDDDATTGDFVRLMRNAAIGPAAAPSDDDDDDDSGDDDEDEQPTPVAEPTGQPAPPTDDRPMTVIATTAGAKGSTTVSRTGVITVPGMTEQCGAGPCDVNERAFQVLGRAASHDANRRHGLLGRDRDTLAAGQTNGVRIRLGRTALASLRKRGRMRVEVLVTVTDARGAQTVRRTLTLRARRG